MTQKDKDDMQMQSGQSQPVNNTVALTAYNPYDYNGAVVVPNVTSSTFAFPRAEDGEHSFGCAYGLSETLERMDPDGTRPMMDIYARLSNPAVRACEASMKALEPNSDWAFVFPSGMGALCTLVYSCCFQSLSCEADGSPGPKRDAIIHSRPLYGGTHAFMHAVVQRFGFVNVEVDFRDASALRKALETYGDRIGLVFCETPANPTLDMIDIRATREIMEEVFEGGRVPILAVDNTFMGIFQQPLGLGADIVLYSATKFLGGHSDLIAGFLVGRSGPTTKLKPFIGEVTDVPIEGAIMAMRTIGGYTTSSDVAQRLWTHMNTYPLRMRRESEVATVVAQWLATHPKIAEVRFPTLLTGEAKEVYERQCLGPSSMIAFRLDPDTKEAAFSFLNALKHCVRAVSLGCVHTYANHPATWTHSDIAPDDQASMGITPGLLRLSIGIEEPEDLIADLNQALNAV
ncbi:MAG: PLP-dependent aspartate aminotransferase family protein [Pseudomonadota bacterium]